MHNLEIKNIKTICKDTIGVWLKRPVDFTFETGQYIKLSIPNPEFPDEKNNERFFSIASAPSNKTELLIASRVTDSGFTRNLIKLGEGDIIISSQPDGDFLNSHHNNSESVFIAGGMGITPFRSFLEESYISGIKQNITLLYGNKDEELFAFINELSKWNEAGVFKSLIAFVDKQIKEQPKFRQGYITGEIILSLFDNPYDKKYFIVGPPVMLDNITGDLAAIGIPEENITVEKF